MLIYNKKCSIINDFVIFYRRKEYKVPKIFDDYYHLINSGDKSKKMEED